MIATVTLNPSLDKNLIVKGLVLEETNRWTTFRRYPGGKGVNVSRVVHELGGDTIAFSFCGGDDGQIFKRLLRKQGVPFWFARIRRAIRSNIIITDVKNNRQTRIDAPGPHISETEFRTLEDYVMGYDPRPQFMVFAGSVPPGIPDDIYRMLIEAVKTRGIRTVLDTDGVSLNEGLKAKPHIIKPNLHEAEEILGQELKDDDDVAWAARGFVKRGIEIALISMGSRGFIAASEDAVLKAVPPRVRVKSTVGAGDATVAGLLLGLSRGENFEEACRLACAAGSATALTTGTQLCRRADVKRLLPKVTILNL